MKANQALDECAQIECHLRNLLSEVELEEAGATITPGRPLHFRVMRVIGHLKDRLAEFSAPEGRPEPQITCGDCGAVEKEWNTKGCPRCSGLGPVELSTPVTPEPPPSEATEAHGYLSRLLTHYAPQCEPLPTLLGVVTQIDNLLTGLPLHASEARPTSRRCNITNLTCECASFTCKHDGQPNVRPA